MVPSEASTQMVAETTTPVMTETMPETTITEQKLPIQYKGWTLPNPPSVEVDDVDDRDPPLEENRLAVPYPEFSLWKKDLDSIFLEPKPPKITNTAFVEWKTSPGGKKRRKKKKKADGDDVSCQSTVVTTVDGTTYIRRSRSSKSSSSSKPSRSSAKENSAKENLAKDNSAKENAPPSFQPAFSKTRYSNQQKFRELANYYKEKMQTETTCQDNIMDDLVAVKMELSDLKEWANRKRDKTKKKRVQFAYPLISSTKYRPRTKPEEIDDLFFSEDDLLDWEEDREKTPPDRFEVIINEDEEHVIASSDCRSISSHDT